jgi:hypothetical protein
MAAKMAAKKLGKEAAKKADDIPDYMAPIRAKEAKKAREALVDKAMIGAGTVAGGTLAVEAGKNSAKRFDESKEEVKPKAEETEEKEYRKGGKVRGCGIARKGLTKGRMV